MKKSGPYKIVLYAHPSTGQNTYRIFQSDTHTPKTCIDNGASYKLVKTLDHGSLKEMKCWLGDKIAAYKQKMRPLSVADLLTTEARQ